MPVLKTRIPTEKKVKQIYHCDKPQPVKPEHMIDTDGRVVSGIECNTVEGCIHDYFSTHFIMSGINEAMVLFEYNNEDGDLLDMPVSFRIDTAVHRAMKRLTYMRNAVITSGY